MIFQSRGSRRLQCYYNLSAASFRVLQENASETNEGRMGGKYGNEEEKSAVSSPLFVCECLHECFVGWLVWVLPAVACSAVSYIYIYIYI